MPHWLLKSAFHHVIATLPGSRCWNEMLQVHVTGSLVFGSDQLRERLSHCGKIVAPLFRLHPTARGGFRALELGTGWYPALPIALHLCGATEVWTFDIKPLLQCARLQHLLELFCAHAATGELQQWLPALRSERLVALQAVVKESAPLEPAELLERLAIHAVVGDARATGLAEQTIDLFFSWGVLEYIPRVTLVELHQEFARIAMPEAASVHFIGLEDEYAAFDRRLSPLHFLRFSEAQWRWLNSALNPIFRLRISDHRDTLREGGWDVVEEENRSCEPALLHSLPLAPEFRGYRREDLAVLDSWLVAKLAGS